MKCKINNKISFIFLSWTVILQSYRLSVYNEFANNFLPSKHRILERYEDIQYYPGYKPIKLKYNHLFFPRFKELMPKNQKSINLLIGLVPQSSKSIYLEKSDYNENLEKDKKNMFSKNDLIIDLKEDLEEFQIKENLLNKTLFKEFFDQNLCKYNGTIANIVGNMTKNNSETNETIINITNIKLNIMNNKKETNKTYNKQRNIENTSVNNETINTNPINIINESKINETIVNMPKNINELSLILNIQKNIKGNISDNNENIEIIIKAKDNIKKLRTNPNKTIIILKNDIMNNMNNKTNASVVNIQNNFIENIDETNATIINLQKNNSLKGHLKNSMKNRIKANKSISNSSKIKNENKASPLFVFNEKRILINSLNNRTFPSRNHFKFSKIPKSALSNLTIESNISSINTTQQPMPLFQEINKADQFLIESNDLDKNENAKDLKYWSNVGSLFTFNQIQSKITEFYDYYKKYASTFSSEIQSHHELKNVIIFSCGILGLIFMVTCKTYCLVPWNNRLAQILKKTPKNHEEQEKIILKGRRLFKQNKEPLIMRGKTPEIESSNSSEEYVNFSKVLK